MPSALRSGGGTGPFTFGPAATDPLCATYTRLPSGALWIPRGRLPTAIVPATSFAATRTTDTSPDASLLTKRRGPANGAKVAAAAGSAGALDIAGGGAPASAAGAPPGSVDGWRQAAGL